MNSVLSFDDFKEMVRTKILEYLPITYYEATVILRTCTKINEQYTGMMVVQRDCNVSPLINLEAFYQEYLETEDLDLVMKKMSSIILSEKPTITVDVNNLDAVKSRLFVKICNAERNKELLETVPHKTFLDLAITYHILLAQNDEGYMTVTITKEILDLYGITLDELHQAALESTVAQFPACMAHMADFVDNLNSDDPLNVLPVDVALDDEHLSLEYPFNMFVLSNNAKRFGANVVLYPELLTKIAQAFHCNFYVIPSSTEECIILPVSELTDTDNLRELIVSVNNEAVAPENFLSNNLYEYDKTKGMLQIVA